MKKRLTQILFLGVLSLGISQPTFSQELIPKIIPNQFEQCVSLYADYRVLGFEIREMKTETNKYTEQLLDNDIELERAVDDLYDSIEKNARNSRDSFSSSFFHEEITCEDRDDINFLYCRDSSDRFGDRYGSCQYVVKQIQGICEERDEILRKKYDFLNSEHAEKIAEIKAIGRKYEKGCSDVTDDMVNEVCHQSPNHSFCPKWTMLDKN